MLKPKSLGLMIAVFIAPGLVLAQDVSIEFTNAPEMPPIKLLNGTNVSIDGEGNLTAQCVLEGQLCDGVDVGGGPVPVAALTRVGTGSVTTGTSTQFNWTVTPAAKVCVTSSAPAVNGWNGDIVAATGGTKNLTFGAAGNYSLNLTCYNDFGVSNEASVAVTVTQGSGGGDETIQACTAPGIEGDPLVQPAGVTGHILPWNSVFGGPFPGTSAWLAPVGAFTLRSLNTATRGPSMVKRYITTSFTAGANTAYTLRFYGAQAIRDAGYTSARIADEIFISVSPCAGDLRPFAPLSTDPWLRRCRALVKEGTFNFGTTGGASACPLSPGQKYYLNISFMNTAGNVVPTTTTCKPGNQDRCEVNFGS